MRRVPWIAAVVLVVGGALWLRLWISQLQVLVSHTTLRMGQTVQLAVTKKIWFGTEPLAHPERAQYITNWESMAVVEPHGKVTAIGTWGERQETTYAPQERPLPIWRKGVSAHDLGQRRPALGSSHLLKSV